MGQQSGRITHRFPARRFHQLIAHSCIAFLIDGPSTLSSVVMSLELNKRLSLPVSSFFGKLNFQNHLMSKVSSVHQSRKRIPPMSGECTKTGNDPQPSIKWTLSTPIKSFCHEIQDYHHTVPSTSCASRCYCSRPYRALELS